MLSYLLATEPTDAALLRDSVENPEAFGVLYDRYARQLLAFVYRRTACPQTAADVVAETFAEAFVARDRFTDLGLTAKPWLFTIARRQLSRWYRTQEVSARARRGLGIPHLAIDDVSLSRIEAEIDFEHISQQVHAALGELPDGQADVHARRRGSGLGWSPPSTGAEDNGLDRQRSRRYAEVELARARSPSVSASTAPAIFSAMTVMLPGPP